MDSLIRYLITRSLVSYFRFESKAHNNLVDDCKKCMHVLTIEATWLSRLNICY